VPVEARQLLAKALLELGDADGARAQLAESLRINPRHAALLELLSQLDAPPSPQP